MKVFEGPQLGLGHRLPVILQTEAAECGLACIAMIAAVHGYRAESADLRRRFGLSLKGATLKDLVRIADQIGLASRPLRLEVDELALLKLPCILHWNLNHFVVLKSVGRTGVVIHDPGFGVRRLSLQQVSRHFTGVALELTPTSRFEPATAPPRVRIGALLGQLVGIKRSLSQLFSLSLAIEVFAIVSPLFLVWVVDHAIVSSDGDLLLSLVLAFSLLLVLQTLISAVRGWVIVAFGASMRVQARANLFSHLLNLPAGYFDSRYMGDIMSRFGSQETIIQAITTEAVIALIDGLMCCVALLLMFVFAPILTVPVVLGALLYALLRWASYTRLRQASMEAIVWAARRDTHFLETLRGIRTIKLFNGQQERRAHWVNLLVETTNCQVETQKLDLLFRTANALLLGSIGILVVWLGAQRVIEGVFSVGMLVAFISYKDQFLRRVSELTNRLVDLRMLRLHAERLADIALTKPEPHHWSGDAPAAPHPVSVEVRDLSFRYGSNDPWVLEKVTFRIEAGESVAIAGSSGCGKTTLLKLLAGLLEPTEGGVYVDGEPLSRIGTERYRSMIGVVMQDDQLFAGSIADNISFFSEYPDEDRVVRCAKMAAVHDDIAAMSMGYATLIGDMGTVLSGGQKQRVLIARALYRKPSILILDEATSHLDVAREKAVNEAIRATRMTRIIIAHRPETIRASGRVIVLDRGRVVSDEGMASNTALIKF